MLCVSSLRVSCAGCVCVGSVRALPAAGAPLLGEYLRLRSAAMRWTRILMAGPKTPTNFVQDGPPAGGFKPVQFQRNLPGGGMSSIAMLGACVLTFSYGMYKVISFNRQRRSVARTWLL